MPTNKLILKSYFHLRYSCGTARGPQLARFSRDGVKAPPAVALPFPIHHRISATRQVSGHEFTRAVNCILNSGFSPARLFLSNHQFFRSVSSVGISGKPFFPTSSVPPRLRVEDLALSQSAIIRVDPR